MNLSDCNDNNAGINPFIADLSCNNVDDDCDGNIDEGYAATNTTCGIGLCAAAGQKTCTAGIETDSCTAGTPAADDANCNNIDEDCDGSVDEHYAAVPTSCGIGPCAAAGELTCSAGTTVDTCTAGTPAIEICGNGIDEDCTGADEECAPVCTDIDGDGYGLNCALGNDCNDNDNAVHPGASDANCNGVDENCDTVADEGYAITTTSCGIGACAAAGQKTCIAGVETDSCTAGTPAADDANCNNIDDDCSGAADEDYLAVPTTCGIGPCAAAGELTCSAGTTHDTCTAGTPAIEICGNGIDENCNGADEACSALIIDSTFDASADSTELRDNGTGQDWYESRAAFATGNASLLTLDTANIGGNSGKKAGLKSYGIAQNAYLTQEIANQTGTFNMSFNIYVDRMQDNAAYDRTGLIYTGVDTDAANCPAGTSNERFVFLAFYDATPGDTGSDLQIRARTLSTQSASSTSAWTSVATNLSYDTWYKINLNIKTASGTYDVYVNDVLVMANVAKYSGFTQNYIKYIAFSADSDGRGDFYIDNVYSPATDLPMCLDADNDGYFAQGGLCGTADCNDNSNAIHPGASDANCNGIDENCDTVADEGYAITATLCGIGACAAAGELICSAGTTVDTCTAGSPAIEICGNGIDENCNGADEECAPVCTDIDGDGYGLNCALGNDCNDNDNAVHPGASDADCNGVDENCDTVADEGYAITATSCGIGACAAAGQKTCIAGVETDSCTAGTPAADDANCNNIDDDCNGAADEDYLAVPTTCGIGPCAAAGELVCSAGTTVDTCTAGTPAIEVCGNGIDENCDGSDEQCAPGCIDNDNDGYGTNCALGDECDDANANIHPGASDANCNNVDENCDGSVDESYLITATSCGVGACAAAGQKTCVAGVETDSCTAGTPAADDANCNNIDDNCNGQADEGYVITSTSCGIGLCAAAGQKTCVAGIETDSCTAGTPVIEICGNSIDENCDGSDEACPIVELLSDSAFDASADDAALRANGAGQDWYESRAAFATGNASLLTLDTNNIGGNSGNKAGLKSYGIAQNAYLTQEFADQTGTFNVSFDIYVDRMQDNAAYDRTGLIYTGVDTDAANCPAGTSNERFVFLAFYDATPGDSGSDLQIRARTLSTQAAATTSQWTSVATNLSYDTWYKITLNIKTASGTYDVYVNDVLVMGNVAKYSGFTQNYIRYVAFSADSDGRGDFYIDNVYSPAR
jgi:hypothetical protein